MAGIYLHIPFCRQACTYCDFHFSTNLSRVADMVNAILDEMKMQKAFFAANTHVDSVYFGGGTPSLLSADQVKKLLEGIREKWQLKSDAEITLECNPDDLNLAGLQELRKLGINRLSIGIQSFHERDLKFMRRSHDAQQALKACELVKEAGFDNYTLDLIYGVPGSKQADWEDNLSRVLAIRPPHISAYALTVEEKTLLHHEVQKGNVNIPEDSAYQAQYFSLIKTLETAGYIQYELSNFALPGFLARHNSAYWHGEPYLGLGPSAHSFSSPERSWNIKNNALYLQAIEKQKLPVASRETLAPDDQLNEYIMTHLRLSKGISLSKIQEKWGFDLLKMESEHIENFIAEGWMLNQEGCLRLSPQGKMVSDRIISDLFQV